jgi:hypothetical protein
LRWLHLRSDVSCICCLPEAWRDGTWVCTTAAAASPPGPMQAVLLPARTRSVLLHMPKGAMSGLHRPWAAACTICWLRPGQQLTANVTSCQGTAAGQRPHQRMPGNHISGFSSPTHRLGIHVGLAWLWKQRNRSPDCPGCCGGRFCGREYCVKWFVSIEAGEAPSFK